ncbi:hypothetical protein, partial [Chromatium okenii]|uniref:hypothetical protein n=1 Tax=Chromatium okenii TaxID=61644 RepID=UPI0026F33DD7
MAKLFLTDGNNVTVSDQITVFGSIGAETLKVNGIGVTADSSIDRFEFGGRVADYTYLVSGNLLSMFKAGVKVITLTVLDTTKFIFTDGSADLVITELNNVTLGGTHVPIYTADAVVPIIFDPTDHSTIVDTTLIGSTQTLEVNETQTTFFDSKAVNTLYKVATGNYTATIDAFSVGDSLDFSDGNDPTVINDNFFDGFVDLNWALSGNFVT